MTDPAAYLATIRINNYTGGIMDRLYWLLKHFELRARVFQAGPLCNSARYDAGDGLGYIHVLKKGTLKVKTAGQPTLHLDEPSLFFYMNPTSHQLIPQAEAELVCASFDFSASLNNPLVKALPDVMALKLADMPSLANTLDLLFYESSEQHSGRQSVLDRLIEIILVQLLRDLMNENRLDIGLLAGLTDPGLARAINAMHAEPQHAWTLDKLAKTANMSRARFANRFRDTVGVTPGSYLTEWRISIAQSMLRGGKPVQLIANSIGYASSSALSRAFTAHVGTSPSDWSKQHGAAIPLHKGLE